MRKNSLRALVDREAQERAAELERTLARARAESVSLLIDEERKIVDDHRREFAHREQEFAATLTASLTATQAQVEQRLAGWAQDLDRAADTTRAAFTELAQRQKQLVSDVHVRLAADTDRLIFDRRSSARRCRGCAARSRRRSRRRSPPRGPRSTSTRSSAGARCTSSTSGCASGSTSCSSGSSAKRPSLRRASAPGSKRSSASRSSRCSARRARRRRVLGRRAAQFSGLVKSSREDAARRLSRELDRAVEVFAREAESVLAERLAHVGDAGAQRLERRLDEATAALEQRRDERLATLDGHIAELEADIRRRLEELGADAEAERAVIEARVQELVRRVGSLDAIQSS